MCGRYYMDEITVKKIEHLVEALDQEIEETNRMLPDGRDIYPSQSVSVLAAAGGTESKLCLEQQIWGFPGFSGKQVIFNARAETVLEKRMFRESVKERRCIIPAARFYEWDAQKNKVTFTRNDGDILFFAGFFQRYPEGKRFIILTTAANASIQKVHDRMPLILEREELKDWIFQDAAVEEFLQKTPCLLKIQQEYEQGLLPFI